jgi:hypothetical protein
MTTMKLSALAKSRIAKGRWYEKRHRLGPADGIKIAPV